MYGKDAKQFVTSIKAQQLASDDDNGGGGKEKKAAENEQNDPPKSVVPEEIDNYVSVVGLEAAGIDAALQYGVNSAEDLGNLAKPASKILTKIAVVGTVYSGVRTAEDIKNGKTSAAVVHGLDTAVGVAGIVAATTVAAVAIIYGISRLYWGPE